MDDRTPSGLIDGLYDLTCQRLKNVRFPVRGETIFKGGIPELRTPTVFKMDIPRREDEQRIAPYVVVQFLTGEDVQKPGADPHSYATVRFLTMVTCEDMGEGKFYVLQLLNLIREMLLQRKVIGRHFILSDHDKIEYLVNPNSMFPYFDGELIAKFEIPPITGG